MTIPSFALLGKGEQQSKHVQCHVGMYYSCTEDDSAQSIATSRPQRAAAASQ